MRASACRAAIRLVRPHPHPHPRDGALEIGAFELGFVLRRSKSETEAAAQAATTAEAQAAERVQAAQREAQQKLEQDCLALGRAVAYSQSTKALARHRQEAEAHRARAAALARAAVWSGASPRRRSAPPRSSDTTTWFATARSAPDAAAEGLRSLCARACRAPA